MPSLTAADAKKLLQFVAEAESLGANTPFTGELLVALGRLIEADWVSYSELDRVRKRQLFYACRPGEEEGAGELELYWEIVNDHPICSMDHKRESAQKLSDFMTLRELRGSRIYALWFGPFSIERQLSLTLPSPLWHTKTLMFDRGPGPDFSERDRLVLDHLQPHLARFWRAARTRRLLSASLEALDRAPTGDPRGVVLFGRAGQVEFASAPARRLLSEFFPDWRYGRLPTALDEWLESGGRKPHIQTRGTRRLSVQRSNGALLLEERTDGVLLTAREREVLAWVARGKTNAEVARLLWLAPSTVRKHLENVYAKLGVKTRTAAVAHFLGVIDAEAS
jgi:DNA-binding CsgD family transcriptional regulator